MTDGKAKQPIRILHLSDIHFRASKRWDADPLLRALNDFIGEEVAGGLKADLVAITGDLAFSGLTDEYKLARAWLDDLWPRLGGLEPDRLLLVPGNHDVDRRKVDFTVEATQQALLTKRDQAKIATVLGSRAQRDLLLKRHGAYLKFVAEWLGRREALPWWQRPIEIRGTKVHVAGLDSAWMACGDADYGRLLLGRYQLTQTVEMAEGDGHDWKIALLHHPWAYLAEFDQHKARDAIHQHCDVVLRGHLHAPRTERILPPDPNRACLELAAGCVYEDSQYPNAFQWIELEASPKRARVIYRAWIGNAWAEDLSQPGCPKGVAEYPLAVTRPRRSTTSRSSDTEIPASYIEYLERSCADVSLLGQDMADGKAIKLSHVYVPALTLPQAEATPRAGRFGESESRATNDPRERSRPVTLLERLDRESVYVWAPAGAGKSTFCRWAVLQCIGAVSSSHRVPAPVEFAEPEPTSLRGRLPLLIALRGFHEGMNCGRGQTTWSAAKLEEALFAWVKDSRLPGLNGASVRAHLRGGSTFVILDGLDEVPVSERRNGHAVYPRELLLTGLASALPVWQKAGNRVLLTSRPYGLADAELRKLGLPPAPLQPLPEELQELFVQRWFDALGKQEVARDLIETIRNRKDLEPLRVNPMLLTAICVLYDSGGQLPEDRYRLYDNIVDKVLYNRYPGDAGERAPIRARLEAVALGMHVGAEDTPREAPEAEVGHSEIERILRDFAALNPVSESSAVEPAKAREELLNNSGLLLPRTGDRAAFYHLSFQEFLAAERVARSRDDIERAFREHWTLPGWRLTLLFLFAGHIFKYRTPQWGLELLGRLVGGLKRPEVKANPAPAVFICEALELCHEKKYRLPDELSAAFRRICLDAIADEVELQSRQALGLCLGRLGDPRVVGLRDDKAYVKVPADTYPYGEGRNKKAVKIAKPFLLGRFPVTNSQYAAFMEGGGYVNDKWWSEAGRAWLEAEKVTEPALWRDRRWNAPNQPVVGVSFWEAEACCGWAGGRLPREGEWEAAARGPKGWAYPWGNDWKDGICNSREAGLGLTSPVGLFPGSRQKELGIEDLAGNVWEWCQDFLDADDPRSGRVLRGGSWLITGRDARSASRVRYGSEGRYGSIGFRVARTI